MNKNRFRVMADYARMKLAARRFYEREKWELSLRTVFIASGFMYTMNQIQSDRELEGLVCDITEKNLAQAAWLPPEDNTVAYYDGFGQIGRGLTYIYMKALVHLGYQVKYITHAANHPHVHAAASEIVGERNILYITASTYLGRIRQLEGFLADSQAHAAFLCMGPDDVVAVGGFSRCPQSMRRHLINLTDHAFWLGTSITDRIINFREFGWKVCMEKRGIDAAKLLYLPYYPGRMDTPLKPLPFQDDDKLVLSGGALYKTESMDNGYYRLVESILETCGNVNFMYLGNGDFRRLKRLKHKYPGRVAYESERTDFFEIMKCCTLYLSTYPYNGGLMTQYALSAGKIPVTWVHPGIESELTIRHEESSWNYATAQSCLQEIKKLLEDDAYRQEREQNLSRFLIDESRFEEELYYILQMGRSIREPGDRAIAFEGFQDLPLENIWGLKYYRLFFRKHGLYMIRFFPWKYISGMLEAILQKLRK